MCMYLETVLLFVTVIVDYDMKFEFPAKNLNIGCQNSLELAFCSSCRSFWYHLHASTLRNYRILISYAELEHCVTGRCSIWRQETWFKYSVGQELVEEVLKQVFRKISWQLRFIGVNLTTWSWNLEQGCKRQELTDITQQNLFDNLVLLPDIEHFRNPISLICSFYAPHG